MDQGRFEIEGMAVGEVISGKYRIDRVLGAGGMGVVVAAHHLQLDTKVAIKFLLPSMLADENAVARFAREARASVKITNEHVARVFDVGALDNGAPYIVMEYLDGSDLGSWLKSKGQLEVSEAVDFVLQACEALGEAHGLGIVHRDLKPANLFCIRRADGTRSVKVLDFGISKFMSGHSSTPAIAMTRTSAVMGTPYYMSPEQMESSRVVDGRTDIWALGVVLFELLSGRVPFLGDTLPEVCMKIATQIPPPLRTLRGDIPDEIDAAIRRCLEKDRRRRYNTVAELATDLAPFGPAGARARAERIVRTTSFADSGARPPSHHTVEATDSVFRGSGAPRTHFADGTISPLGNTSDAVPRRGVGWMIFGGAAVAAIGGAAIALLVVRSSSGPTRATSSANPTAAPPPGVTTSAPPVVLAPPVAQPTVTEPVLNTIDADAPEALAPARPPRDRPRPAAHGPAPVVQAPARPVPAAQSQVLPSNPSNDYDERK